MLNLAFENACEMQLMRNMMSTLKEVCVFFKYSPTHRAKINATSKTGTLSELKSLCKTCWLACHDTLDVFGDVYNYVYSSDHGYIQHIAYLSEFNTYKINSGYIQIKLFVLSCYQGTSMSSLDYLHAFVN